MVWSDVLWRHLQLERRGWIRGRVGWKKGGSEPSVAKAQGGASNGLDQSRWSFPYTPNTMFSPIHHQRTLVVVTGELGCNCLRGKQPWYQLVSLINLILLLKATWYKSLNFSKAWHCHLENGVIPIIQRLTGITSQTCPAKSRGTNKCSIQGTMNTWEVEGRRQILPHHIQILSFS